MVLNWKDLQKKKDQLVKTVNVIGTGLAETQKQADIKKSAKKITDVRTTKQYPGVPITKITNTPKPLYGNTSLSPSMAENVLINKGITPSPTNVKNFSIKEDPTKGVLPSSLKNDNRSAKQKQEDSERAKEYYNFYNTNIRRAKEAWDMGNATVLGIKSGTILRAKKLIPTSIRAIAENINMDPFGQLDMFGKRNMSELEQAREEYSVMKGETEDVYYNSTLARNPLYNWAMDTIKDVEIEDEDIRRLATEGKSELVKEVFNIAQSSASFLATVAATVITKNPTALAAFGTSLDSLDTYNEARKTQSPSGALMSVSADASVTFALEKIGWDALMDTWSKPLAKQISDKIPLFKNITLKAPVATAITGNAVSSGITEGVQEVVQTMWQNAVAKFGYDHTRGIMDGVVEAFLLGSVLGGGATAVYQTKQAIEDKENINKAKEELKSKLGVDDTQAQALASYLHSFTRTESGMFKNKVDSMFKEKRTANYKGLQDAGSRPGIDIPGELPVPEKVTTAPVVSKEKEYKPTRKVPEAQAYNNSDFFYELDYHGERVTTDGVVLEFNSTVSAPKNKNTSGRVLTQENIDRIVPEGDLKPLSTKAVYTNGASLNGKGKQKLELVWMGEPSSKVGEGVVIKKQIFDYIKGKYPLASFKYNGSSDSSIAVFEGEKIVSLFMPLTNNFQNTQLGEESELYWRAEELTGNSNVDRIESDLKDNTNDTSSKRQISSPSGVSGEQSGGVYADNQQSPESGQRTPSQRERILGADRERSGTSKGGLNKKAKELLDSGKKPEDFTDEDIELLKSYSGMGGSGEAGRGLLDEYYTPPKVIDKMWALARKHGFTGGSVLEPSAGVGRFIDRGPDENVKYTALEIDDTSSKIAKIVLGKKADVKQMPFENLFVTETGKAIEIENTYNLIIGNPPYGEHRGYYKGLGEESKISKYEDYFIKRSLDLAKDNGLVVMVVPSGFLKTTVSYSKKQIAKSGELVEAYRLPEKIFDKTSIGTDILVFKKNTTADDNLLEQRLDSLAGDSYFKENKSKILGETKERKSRFGKMEVYVTGNEDVLDNIVLTESQDNGPKVFKEVTEKITKKKKALEGTESTAKVEEYSLREETGQLFSTMHLTDADKNIWRNKSADGSLVIKNLTGAEINTLNIFNGKYFDDFDYLQGNIYEKIDALENENISEEKKDEQRAKLEKILPKPKKLENIYLNPLGDFASSFKYETSTARSDVETLTLKEGFLDYLRGLPRDAFAPSDMWETMGYVRGDRVNTRGDVVLANTIKKRRKHVAEKLFPKFLETLDKDTKTKIEDQFNKEKNGFVSPDYKKVPLFVDGLDMTFGGRGLKIGEYKIDSIGFLSNRGTGINANGVGLGKTMMAIISTAQDVQKGWYKRPLFIVPKGVYNKWIEEIRLLFPKQKVVGLGNLGVGYGIKSADDIKAKINDGDFTVMTYEAIAQLGFKPETQSSLLGEINNAYTEVGNKTERARAKKMEQIQDISGKGKIRAEIKVEDLGFDNLIVDEAHKFKNIFSRAKENKDSDSKAQSGRWGGITGQSSARGVKMWLLSQYVQNKNDGRGVKLLTATPFTNNPLEFYNVLSLVAMKDMKAMGVDNINTFMDTFLKTTKKYVVKSGGKYDLADVVEDWQNKDILKGLIKRYIDFKDGEDYGVIRPTKFKKDYRFNATKQQLEYLQKAQELLDPKLKNKGGSLMYIDEAKKITLSPYLSRYYNGPLPTPKEFVESSPKLMGMMTMIKANRKKTGQVIYFPYEVDQMPLLREYLVDVLKYKPSEVGIIHGKIDDNVRERVKKDFNSGKVKVIIGSDAIKEGVDLQERSTDLYLTSYPWTPTDVIQVEGRIHRQGNIYKNVRINFLSLKDSVDSFLFQKLDTKTKRLANADAITQTLEGDNMDYESMTSDLITDPAFKLQVKTAIKKERADTKINGLKSEIALLEEQTKKYKEAEAEIQVTQEWLDDPRNAESWNMDNYRKKNKKSTKTLETLKERNVDPEVNQARISELEKVLEATIAKNKESEERLKEESKNLPEFIEKDPEPNDFKALEKQLLEENKTFIVLKGKDEDQTVKASKASSLEENVLPSVMMESSIESEPLTGADVPSLKSSETLPDESLESIDEKSKTLSSQRMKFLERFDMGYGLVDTTRIDDFISFVNTNVSEYDQSVKDLTIKTQSEAYFYRVKESKSVASKLKRKREKTLGTLNDMIGGTIVTENIDNVLGEYKKDNSEKSIDDMRTRPSMWGYDGVHLEKELSSGMFTEIQVHTREKLYQKEYAHTIYEKYREYFESNEVVELSDQALKDKMGEAVYSEYLKDIQLSRDVYAGIVPVPQEFIDKANERINKNKIVLEEEVSTENKTESVMTGSAQTVDGLKPVKVSKITKDLSLVDVGGKEMLTEAKTSEEIKEEVSSFIEDQSNIKEGDVVEINEKSPDLSPMEKQAVVVSGNKDMSVVEVDGGFKVVESKDLKPLEISDEIKEPKKPKRLKVANEKTAIEDLPPSPPESDLLETDGPDDGTVDFDLTKFERMRVIVQDKAIGLDKAQKIMGEGKNVQEDVDMYMEYELYSGAVTAAIEKFERNEWKPLQDELVKFTSLSPDHSQLIQNYLWLSHAEERNKNHYDGAAGITTKEARMKLKELKQLPQFPEMQKIAQQFQSLAKKLPEYLYKNGMIKQKEYESLLTLYKNYIPLQRILPDNGDFSQALGIGKGFDTRGTDIKKAKGSDLEVANILESIRLNWERAIIRVHKNNVGKTVYKFAKDYSKLSLFKLVRGKLKLMEVDGDIIRTIEPPSGDNILTVKIDGVQKYIKITDPTVANALKNLDSQPMNVAMRTLLSFTRFYSMINTSLNPEFIISNAIKDIQTASLNTSKEFGMFGMARNAKVFPEAYKGVFDALRGNDTTMAKLYNQMRELGGTTGYYNLSNREEIANKIREGEDALTLNSVGKLKSGGKKVLELIDFINDVVENGTRLAVYKVAIDQGFSPKKAAQLAKNATVNFNKKGTIGPGLNALYAFSNASIQGSANVIKTLSNPKSFAKITTLISVVSALLQSWNRAIDEEGYEKIDSSIRESNWVFMVGGGNYIKLGLPYGYNVIKVTADNIYELSIGKTVAMDSFKSVSGAMINAYNPVGGADLFNAYVPTFFRPIQEVYVNKGWHGGNIAPMNMTGVKESLNYSENENPIFVNLSKYMSKFTGGSYGRRGVLEVSPAGIEYLWNQYTGGVGRFIMGNAKTVVNLATDPENIETKDIPFWRKVVGKVDVERYNRNYIYDIIDKSKKTPLTEDEKMDFMRVLKEEGENKRITMKEAKDYMNKAKSGQEDLTQTKKVVDYIERQNWSEEKLNQFLNEKLTDNSWTKAQGLGTFTKTQIKMIRSEL